MADNRGTGRPNNFFIRAQRVERSSSSIPYSDPFQPLPPSSQPIPHRPAPATRVLAVEIPPASLRPLAFRVFTKKHGLTLKADALTALCSFIGRKCGADWRDSGKGEKLLDEIARTWKRNEGPKAILVEGGDTFNGLLKAIDVPHDNKQPVFKRQGSSNLEIRTDASGDVVMSETTDKALSMEELENIDPKKYFYVVDAFKQPRYNFNASKKQYEKAGKPTLLPSAQIKTLVFKNRYHTLHQRILRNQQFAPPTFQEGNILQQISTNRKITPICNLLGRYNTREAFLLFGILQVSPSGTLNLVDPTGSVDLDISEASGEDEASWFCPGCFALLSGYYKENGIFIVDEIVQPMSESREDSCKMYGHVDFLGVNVTLDMGGSLTDKSKITAMQRVEMSLKKNRIIALSEVELDVPKTLTALRKVFSLYEEHPPFACILIGNFVKIPFGTNADDSVSYKELFNELARILGDYSNIANATTFVFVPGDNDPWISTFSGGASPLMPRKGIDEIFTNRVRARLGDRANFTSNPTRLCYFSQEIAVARDACTARFRRQAIRIKEEGREGGDTEMVEDGIDAQTKIARKTVKTLLSQSTLSPFSQSVRPLLWDYAQTLSLYPLPTTLILADPSASAFSVRYQGCTVLNPGRLVDVDGRTIRWAEYYPAQYRGMIRESSII